MAISKYVSLFAVTLAGCNYGGPAPDPNCGMDDYEIVENGVPNPPLDFSGESENEESDEFVPADGFAADPFAEEQDFQLEQRPGPVPIADEETDSVTLPDHYAGHTSVRVAACLLVDNASYRRARIRIRFPDGSERIVTTAGSANDCRTVLIEVPIGGPYRVELADGCGPGGRQVVPFAGFYEETLSGTRRAFHLECYEVIGR